MPRPNFIIFLTDDQGYGDLSCLGAGDLRTPHFDALAASGALFTNWYSNSPVCSPSRAALLTGRYPAHAGVRSILAGHRTATGLPPEIPTLATALKRLGYQTFMAGKWHLGLQEASRPHRHGFEHWFGFLAGCIDYYSHIFYWGMNQPGPGVNPTHDLWEDGREIWRNGEYFTEAVTRKALEYLRQAQAAGAPFFLYVPYNAPHYPMHAPAPYMQRFAHLPWPRQVMAAMIAAVDDGVGLITAELKRLGLAENTCIFFTSDNGPSRESRNWLDGTLENYYGGSTGRLKGHKFSLYEGGVRVPGILCWPARIRAGQVLHAPCASMDIFPTFLQAAGGDSAAYEIDGVNLLPYVAEGKAGSGREIFWEMGGQTALRRDHWKLVLNGQLVEHAEAAEPISLCDLATDPGETRNCCASHPRIAAELKARAENWRQSIEAQWNHPFRSVDHGTVTHP